MTSRDLCFLGGLMLNALVSIPGIASADTPRSAVAPSAPATEAELIRRGRLARAAGRCAEAKADFKAALSASGPMRLTPVQRAIALGELGLCELAEHRYRDAAAHLSDSLDQDSTMPRAYRDPFDAALREAAGRVGRLYVTVTPPDAELLLDGQRVGTGATSYQLFVEPGAHTIRTRLTGYEDGVQWFDVGAGMKHSTHLVMPRGAQTTARAPEKKANETGAVSKAPPPAPSRSTASVARIVGAALAGATVVAGGASLLWSDKTEGELRLRASELRSADKGSSTCSSPGAPAGCSGLDALKAERDRWKTVGWVCLGTGGAIGALTLVSLLVGRATPPSEGVHVVPSASGQHAGLTMVGRW